MNNALAIGALIVSVTPSWAQSESPTALPSAASGNLLAMTGALLLVVMLVFAVGWVVKRFMHGRLTGRAAGSIKVIDQLMVGTRERLVVVEFGRRQILLGMVPGKISRLDAVDLDSIDLDSPSDFQSALPRRENEQ